LPILNLHFDLWDSKELCLDVRLLEVEDRYQGEVTHLALLGVNKQSRHFGF